MERVKASTLKNGGTKFLHKVRFKLKAYTLSETERLPTDITQGKSMKMYVCYIAKISRDMLHLFVCLCFVQLHCEYISEAA